MTVRIPDDPQLAWAVALFEGEGSFTHKTGPGCAPLAQLAMSDGDVVQAFHLIVGVGRLGYYDKLPDLVRADGTRCPRKPIWQWQAAARDDFEKVAAMLGPWLSNRRRAQLAAVRQKRADVVASGLRERRVGSRTATPDELREEHRLAAARYRKRNPNAGKLATARWRRRTRTQEGASF
jgi:hypothetical protein